MNENKLPVSVLMVSFHTRELTLKALRALFSGTKIPKQVIVVDNASSDGSVEAIEEKFPHVQIIRNDHNVGFGRANNQALLNVTEPYVWLLNSDTEVGERTLEELVVYMDEHKRVGVVGPQLVYPNGSLQSVGGFFPTAWNVFFHLFPVYRVLPHTLQQRLRLMGIVGQEIRGKEIVLDYVTGAALFARTNVLREVNGFDERHFLYFEETDLCYRIAKKGWDIRAIHTDPVIHIGGGSFRSRRTWKRMRAFYDGLEMFVNHHYDGYMRWCIIAQLRWFSFISMVIKSIF